MKRQTLRKESQGWKISQTPWIRKQDYPIKPVTNLSAAKENL